MKVTAVEPVVLALAPDIWMEIDPRLELLAGVQAWTSWTKPGNPGAPARDPLPYFSELKACLADWRDAPALRQSEDLLKKGFAWDAPPVLVLATRGGLAFDEPAEGFSEYLIGRAKGRRSLVKLGASLRKLAAACAFGDFFERHRGYYQDLIKRSARGLDAEIVSHWLKSWFGAEGHHVFHYVLAPAMLPGGGYGCTIVRQEDSRQITHVYQIILSAEQTAPTWLQWMALHEFGHAFVNPAIGDQIPLASRAALQAIFQPVQIRMSAMAYPDLTIFLNELVLRATTVRAQLDLGLITADGVAGALAVEANRGFYCIATVYDLLEEYVSDRGSWPNFHSFGPVLLERLAARAELVLASHPDRSPKPPVESLSLRFNEHSAFPAELQLSIGAVSEANSAAAGLGLTSQVTVEADAAGNGASALVFRGDAQTNTWQYASCDILVKKGTLKLSCCVRSTDIHPEGTQFPNAWVGFILTDNQEQRIWKILEFSGSQDWGRHRLSLDIDPAAIRGINFGIFLSMSGELAIAELDLDWK